MPTVSLPLKGGVFIPFRVRAITLRWSSSEVAFSLTFARRPADEVGRPRTRTRDRENFGRTSCSKMPRVARHPSNGECVTKQNATGREFNDVLSSCQVSLPGFSTHGRPVRGSLRCIHEPREESVPVHLQTWHSTACFLTSGALQTLASCRRHQLVPKTRQRQEQPHIVSSWTKVGWICD